MTEFAALSIRSISVRPVVVPLVRPIRTASGNILDAPLILVDVLTEEGITGRGYVFAYSALMLRSIVQFLREIAPELVGKSVSPRARMRQLESRLKLVGWQGFAGMAVGGIDMALWDALASAMGCRLSLCSGASHARFPHMTVTASLTRGRICRGWNSLSRADSRP
jgi:mandelate racemase